jgi:hypothetical protein
MTSKLEKQREEKILALMDKVYKQETADPTLDRLEKLLQQQAPAAPAAPVAPPQDDKLDKILAAIATQSGQKTGNNTYKGNSYRGSYPRWMQQVPSYPQNYNQQTTYGFQYPAFQGQAASNIPALPAPPGMQQAPQIPSYPAQMFGQMPMTGQRPPITCHYCGKIGHIQRVCRKKQRDFQQQGQGSQ